MESPEDCPSEIYAIMRLCWEKDPKMRPSFQKLRERLQAELNKHESATESWLHFLIFIRTSAFFIADQTFYLQIITLYCTGHSNNVPACKPVQHDLTWNVLSILHLLIYFNCRLFFISNTLFQKSISQWMCNLLKCACRPQSKRQNEAPFCFENWHTWGLFHEAGLQ